MEMSVDDIKHCLKVMVDCEVCEECNLYGTTGTDHCEHDCVCGALDIINKYQKIQEIIKETDDLSTIRCSISFSRIKEVVEDGNVD